MERANCGACGRDLERELHRVGCGNAGLYADEVPAEGYEVTIGHDLVDLLPEWAWWGHILWQGEEVDGIVNGSWETDRGGSPHRFWQEPVVISPELRVDLVFAVDDAIANLLDGLRPLVGEGYEMRGLQSLAYTLAKQLPKITEVDGAYDRSGRRLAVDSRVRS